MPELQIITSNNGKIKEFKEIFGDSKYLPVQNNIDYPEIQASSLEDVVDFGLSWLGEKIEPPFVIDDSGVFIDNFDGFVGGAVSPNLLYSRFQSSVRPASYPSAQIPIPLRSLNNAKSYFNDRERLSSYQP